jgi:Ca2+-binding EF-hand superfamily protein
MRRATTGVLAFSTFFIAGLASAQTDGREQRFNERDANHDGYLTLSEYGGHPGNFRALDGDGDNRLSRDEFVSRRRGGGGGGGGGPVVALPDEFAYLDLNADGNLSRAEWYGRDVPFDRVDRNNDGRITSDEFRTQPVADNRQDRFYGLDSNSDGVLSRREWRESAVVFGSVDTNDDGVVSLREYIAMPETSDNRSVRFDELDRNQDGYLVWNEWRRSGINVAFDVVDRNGDSRITLREFQNSNADNPTQQFGALDGNRDGFLSTWEWKGTRSAFNQRDLNRDGRISRNEFTRYPYVSQR